MTTAIAMTADSSRAVWEQVQREFDCPHRDQVLTVKVTARDARHYRMQCRRCGHNVRTVHKASLDHRQIREAAPFDDNLAREWFAARSARHDELRQEAADRAKHEFDAWYADYLRSPTWRRKRALVLGRAGGTCEGCLERPATQVHHLTYEHVGNELLFELRAVCDDCHRIAHSDHR